MRTRLFLLFLLFLCSLSSLCQVDIKHYKYELTLRQRENVIDGTATITVAFTADATRIFFDLASVEGDKGMQAFAVKEDGQDAHFDHHNDRLLIDLPKPAKTGEQHVITIVYTGIPKDGLIISENRYGDRTFFADNWPNRAHQWIPCNDRPDDKASFEFTVTAPERYRIISNGLRTEEKSLGSGLRRTSWSEATPLSPYNMVIGAAAFAVKEFTDSPKGIPVSAWVYQQDSAKGFYDYALAPSIINYFTGYLSQSFPYRKLANVQSKTRFGGMENASAIFYAEESVTGDRKWEEVLAHEIAHQWFGDMATEKSFAHLWLSEGFATYLTNLYIDHKYGRDSMAARLRDDRARIIDFVKRSDHPIVDSTADYMSLLNANSYQKGGWVLHLLRREIGDTLFRAVLKTYYDRYKGSNADTRDFERVVEDVTHRDWKTFFDQWLYRPGLPVLKLTSGIKNGQAYVTIRQEQSLLYDLSVEVSFSTNDGKPGVKEVRLHDRETTIPMPLANPGARFTLDPNVNLLFQEKK